MRVDIETMLKTYRIDKAKVKVSELEIEQLEYLLSIEVEENPETDREVIEGMSIKASSISDMPKSITNMFKSVTENVTLSYMKEWRGKPLTNDEIRQQIKDIKSRMYTLGQQIKLIDEVLLPCLNVKEDFIIRSLYIEQYSWREIIDNYSQRFEAREERTLKDMRKFALKKMYDIITKSA